MRPSSYVRPAVLPQSIYSNHSIRGRRTLKYRHIKEIARLKRGARCSRKNSPRLRSISRRRATGGTIIRTGGKTSETGSQIIWRLCSYSQTKSRKDSYIQTFDFEHAKNRKLA